MMVTMYLKGPMKASKRLSPLIAKALGRGRASRHTTLAARITGAGGQLGGKGAQSRHKTCLQVQKPAQSLSIRAPKHPRPRSARI